MLTSIYSLDILKIVHKYISLNFRIASFDLGTINMGVSLLSITIPPPILLIGSPTTLSEIKDHLMWLEYIIDQFMVLEVCDLWNPIGQNKVDVSKIDIHEMGVKLNKLLKEFDKLNPTHMVYEYQMDANDKTRVLSHYVIYHYIHLKMSKCPGSYKNTITLNKDLAFCEAAKRKSDKYDANKLHSSVTYLYWNAVMNPALFNLLLDNMHVCASNKKMIKPKKIEYDNIKHISTSDVVANPSKLYDLINVFSYLGIKIDDKADSFTQILGGLKARKFSF